ncbi:'Cold-shock' DNA-binding domain containing protein, putative [Angomonas deanei]|uniref:'Cold-shock' DNA-binding domain containing protein, putative n=1 Tax=Angomonas deanei TaxID=59799 RepID=A0A7G2CJ61_9TRYP|nr:'Cold-shock' DNA-binding domain containing protein, putative [Angomonas deanei]
MLPTAMLLNKGKVVSWITGRGFGFIEDEADNKQHFVHFSAIQVEANGYRSLSVGQEVEFEVTNQDGRTRADNVTGPGGEKLPSGPRPPEGGQGTRLRWRSRPRRQPWRQQQPSGRKQQQQQFSDEF